MADINQIPLSLDQEYFFWGCGKLVQYGLYSPVTERILFVDDDIDVLEYVMFLMSSKIRLLIVPLHTATNFNINLIDNTCCTQWSITNWPVHSLEGKFDLATNRKRFIVDQCGQLVEKSNKILSDVQNFIFLSYFVIKFFKFSHNSLYRIFSNLIKLPFSDFDDIKKIEYQCYQIIYSSTDYELAKEKTKRLYDQVKDLL